MKPEYIALAGALGGVSITGILGISAAIIGPRIQARYQENERVALRRIQHVEQIREALVDLLVAGDKFYNAMSWIDDDIKTFVQEAMSPVNIAAYRLRIICNSAETDRAIALYDRELFEVSTRVFMDRRARESGEEPEEADGDIRKIEEQLMLVMRPLLS